jgi:hypothetical protein
MTNRSILLCAALLSMAAVGRADWQQVESIMPGAPILVRAGFVTDAGKFVSATADAVTVDTQTGRFTVRKNDVDDVLVFRSRSERVHRALLIGGVAAGATAAAFFPLFSTLAHPDYAIPAITTAGNGASFGLVGFRTGLTKRIYRRTQ